MASGRSRWRSTRTSCCRRRRRDGAQRPMTTTPLPAGAPGRLALRLKVGRLGRAGWLAVAGVVSLGVVLVAGIVLGSVDLAPTTTVAILAKRVLGIDLGITWAPTAEAIVMDLRLPRVLTAMVVGTGLAVAGATFQGLLRNPLADPYVLGTASGAALGAAIAVILPVRGLVLQFGLLHLLAFVGALGSVTLVYRLSRTSPLAPLTSLLLTGYAVGSLLAAGLSLTMYMSGSGLRQIFSYLLGGFDGASWTRLAVDVKRERVILLSLASLVTAAGVAVAGLIGFVGLVVPHLVRLLVGPNARLVLPISPLFGASLLAAADVVARLLGGVPVGVITAVIGAPFFLALLRRARTGYEL